MGHVDPHDGSRSVEPGMGCTTRMQSWGKDTYREQHPPSFRWRQFQRYGPSVGTCHRGSAWECRTEAAAAQEILVCASLMLPPAAQRTPPSYDSGCLQYWPSLLSCGLFNFLRPASRVQQKHKIMRYPWLAQQNGSRKMVDVVAQGINGQELAGGQTSLGLADKQHQGMPYDMFHNLIAACHS